MKAMKHGNWRWIWASSPSSRRIFSRFGKLDLMFIAFIYFALIIEALR